MNGASGGPVMSQDGALLGIVLGPGAFLQLSGLKEGVWAPSEGLKEELSRALKSLKKVQEILKTNEGRRRLEQNKRKLERLKVIETANGPIDRQIVRIELILQELEKPNEGGSCTDPELRRG
jgi:hypothetical protein